MAVQRETSFLSLTQQHCRESREGSCPLTIELFPFLALGGLQLNLPPEVACHLSVVGERRVDGEQGFRGL